MEFDVCDILVGFPKSIYKILLIIRACTHNTIDRDNVMVVENKGYPYLITYTISSNTISTKTMISTTDEYNKSQPINRLMFRVLYVIIIYNIRILYLLPSLYHKKYGRD